MNERITFRTMRVEANSRRYALFVPDGHDPARRTPLAIFLHGTGERGDDGERQVGVGIGPALGEHPERFACLVVLPQCPLDRWWTNAFAHIDAVREDVAREHRLDPCRLYLTGASMGAYGAWRYGAAHAGELAALLPVCGGGRPEDAALLASVPVWAFHGADDKVVPVAESRRMVAAVRRAGGDVRYTEYEGLGHNAWDAAYGDPDVIAWMLSRCRPDAG